METNLDQKQLLVLGYLRELLTTSNLDDYQLGFDEDEPKSQTPVLRGIDTPPISALTPFSRFDQHMQLFNLGVPQFELPRSNSMDSCASDLSDHSFSNKYSDYTIALNIIQNVYFYFNRSQNYLLLLGGSEDNKDNSYNQIQIINLRNISDIKQKIDYPYTNYRLRPVLWRETINYENYFTKSFKKYLTAESKVVPTTAPIATINTKAMKPLKIITETNSERKLDLKPLISQSKTTKIKVSVDSPHSPWTAMNSPYSPFAQLAAGANNSKLTPYAQLDEMKMNSRQRAKSTTNIAKLAKKDKKKKKVNKTGAMKKKRKSTNSFKKKSKSSSKLLGKKPAKRRASTMLPSKKAKKKYVKNVITNNNTFDKYSFGQCIMNISNNMVGTTVNWPWFKGKYKSEIRRGKDNLEFAKYKMFIRCGGIYTADDEYSNENDLILFNAANLNDIGRQIDSYYCKLPPFKQRVEGPAVVYNGCNNLLSFGGYSYDDGKALKWIYSLNLNVKRTKFKWRKYSKCPMHLARYDAGITHIINNKGQNKFLIIGGKGSSTDAIRSVEIFDSSKTNKEGSKCKPLAELHFPRFKCGSTQLKGNSNKIVVCGGMLYGKGAKQVEIFDLHKNKWIIHPTSLQYDHQHPSIWNECREINPNILYVAGNNISFGAKKGSLGFIEYTDLRMKTKKFKLLYNEPVEELYEFWGFRANVWEPRSLLHFAL